ncbi:MAG TPA: cobalamin biosynthesis protein CobW [Hyphomicrobiaceae bacterium]|nr:cobalamin biosynthesis protein CobW [Hyphomicrobiaceae bacterium]
MAQRIPCTIITGFLGAGKTTLIRSLLEKPSGRRLALIINEFGDIGVDGELLKSCGVPGCSEEDIVELANGCICCTVADDFLPTLQSLLWRPAPPDHIVIETSGLALPQPLLRAFSWPEVRTRVTVDGVVTVVDGRAVADGRFAADEDAVARQRAEDESLDHESPLEELFEDQLSCADLIVLSKADLLTPEELAQVEARIAQDKRKGVAVVRAANGNLPVGVLLGIGASAEDDAHNRRSHHDDEDHGAEDHNDFESFSVGIGSVEGPDSISARIRQVLSNGDVLRVKGFLSVSGKPMRLVVQGVGQRLETYFDRPWRPDEARTGKVVVIGLKGLDRARISSVLVGAPS